MAKSKSAIKTRLKSINSTKKITGAMELISNIKFQKALKQLSMNRDYSNGLEEIFNQTLAYASTDENVYAKGNNALRRFCFVFVSDMGLCGGYNVNLLKYLKENYTKDDLFYVIGSNYGSFFEKNGFSIVNQDVLPSDEMNYNIIQKAMENALERFLKGEVKSIDIAYTKFVNNVTFVPSNDVIVPVKLESKKAGREILMEPNASTVLNKLIPLVTCNCLYNRFLQAKTTEQASRRFAMENATDNANELIENLTLEYNQARQAAITQEITEIVSGADAL